MNVFTTEENKMVKTVTSDINIIDKIYECSIKELDDNTILNMLDNYDDEEFQGRGK